MINRTLCVGANSSWPKFVWRLLSAALALLALAASAQAGVTQCTDDASLEDRVKPVGAASGGAPGTSGLGNADAPQVQLQQLLRVAIQRSDQILAQQSEAIAAAHDLDETKGARYPQVSVNGVLGQDHYDVASTANGHQSNVSLNVSTPLIDFGRERHLIDWRSHLQQQAQATLQATREQVVLEALTNALERNRYRVQAQVYQQYARKMSCLVNVLEKIVNEDKGRTSELIQARKSQLEAEISRDAAVAQQRQIEARLHKELGPGFVPGDGISVAMMSLPQLQEIDRQLLESPDVRQLDEEADALQSYAKAIEDGQQPQVNWLMTKTAGRAGQVTAGAWTVGLQLNYTLFNGGSDKAARSAAQVRAQAARERRDELVATRQARAAEFFEAASSAFSRAKSYAQVLRDSDLVRDFTFRQWSELGRRSLFDVMSAESDHFNQRIAYVNALHDGYEANAQMRSIGPGLLGGQELP